MGDVLAARFDDFSAADSAAHALFAAGVPTDAVSMLFAAEPGSREAPRRVPEDGELDTRRSALVGVAALATMGAIFGVALALTFTGSSLAVLVLGPMGACAGAWAGAKWLAERAMAARRKRDEADALLTVHVGSGQIREAARILLDAGAEYVETARGRWQHGRWVEAERPIRVKSPGHIRNLASF